tara:strand:+ start:631 stop:1197 length:567 start_codon:yes stop_codon:yes gene_type:complete
MRGDILNENSNALLQSNEKFDTFVKHAKVCNVTIANSQAIGTVEATWLQPANSVLTNCYIVCTDALAITSGDVGYQVGNATAGGQIIAAAADEILDGGTDVLIGALTYPGMGVSLPGGTDAATAKVAIDAGAIANGFVYDVQDDTTHVASIAYTSSARSVFCGIVLSTAVDSDGGGNFAFCFEYLQFS